MHDSASSNRRIPQLDGLRGIAILLVIFFHYVSLTAQTKPGSIVSYFLAIGRFSWTGVDLFFVLSGFLLGGILLDARGSSGYFRAFYARRFYRIVPLYAVMCLLFWVLQSQAIRGNYVSLRALFEHPMPWYSYATLTQNFWMVRYGTLGSEWLSPTWSLAVEEQFYLTLPLLIWSVKRKWLPHLLVLIIVAAPILRVALLVSFPHSDLLTYVMMPCRADALMLGVLAAWSIRNPAIFKILKNKEVALYLALTVLLLGCIVLTKFYGFEALQKLVGYTWIAVLYVCALVIAVTQGQSFLGRILSSFPLRFLGEIAYGVYLFHVIILDLCHGLILGDKPQLSGLANAGVTLLALLITVFLAKLSWTYLEKPLVKRGHSWTYSKRPTTAYEGRMVPEAQPNSTVG
jgi:peptidoglycan/LPS O-acetylase OafA/YrhL